VPGELQVYATWWQVENRGWIVRKQDQRAVTPGFAHNRRHVSSIAVPLLDPGKLDLRSGALNRNSSVSQEHERRVCGLGEIRMIVITQDGIDRRPFGDRCEKPPGELGRAGPAAGAGTKISGRGDKVILQRQKHIQRSVMDPIPPSEMEIGDVGDAEPDRSRGHPANRHGQMANDNPRVSHVWNTPPCSS
jgi:hypothetical protein